MDASTAAGVSVPYLLCDPTHTATGQIFTALGKVYRCAGNIGETGKPPGLIMLLQRLGLLDVAIWKRFSLKLITVHKFNKMH